MYNKVFNKGNLFTTLTVKDAIFGYEVVSGDGKVKTIKYEDRGRIESYPEKAIRIKALGAICYDEFIVSVINDDALKELRAGELISIKLNFSVKKKADGTYEQYVTGSDIVTLNEYYQMREQHARYMGALAAEREQAD